MPGQHVVQHGSAGWAAGNSDVWWHQRHMESSNFPSLCILVATGNSRCTCPAGPAVTPGSSSVSAMTASKGCGPDAQVLGWRQRQSEGSLCQLSCSGMPLPKEAPVAVAWLPQKSCHAPHLYHAWRQQRLRPAAWSMPRQTVCPLLKIPACKFVALYEVALVCSMQCLIVYDMRSAKPACNPVH